MNTETFKISSLVADIFRNGTRDNINNNPEIVGFIIGALDNGFSVKFNGFLPIAKKGKVEILLRFERDSDILNMVIFKGKDKIKEFTYGINGFLWVNVSSNVKGSFYHNSAFICSYN